MGQQRRRRRAHRRPAAWEWERKLDTLLAVDLKGTIACSYAAGEVMRGQERGGTIINMSWDQVATGMAGENPQLFAAVKGGVLAFSKSLARARARCARERPVPGLDRDRVRCARRSRVPPLGGTGNAAGALGQPQDVAGAALYLASPEAAFVTGQAINVNGGVVM